MNLKRARVAAALALIGLATPAAAQVTRVGDTFSVLPFGTRGTAIAYDTRNNVYLVVSTFGVLRGRYLSPDGVPLGDPFVIQASGLFTHFPDVAFSPDAAGGAGGFLVTWHESDSGITSVHSRLVSFTAGLISADVRLAFNESWWEAASEPSVAYATGSKEFLVTWRSFGYDVRIARVDLAGAQIGAAFSLTADGSGVYDQYPRAAYNPAADEFMVAWSATVTSSVLKVQRIKAGTGQLIGGAQQVAAAVTIFATDITYNSATGQFLTTWYQDPPKAIFGRVINADGSPAGAIAALSTRYRAYDGLAVAHNPVSGTFFAVSHDSLTVEDGGVEIDGAGAPLTSGVQVTGAGGAGNFYPQIAANPTRDEWTVVAARSFTQTIGQRIRTATRFSGGGGGGGGNPLIPKPVMANDLPTPGSSVTSPFTIAGWALDLGSPLGTGVNSIHIWAYPNPGSGASPIFVGHANYGAVRPDVAAAFGSAQFGPSGYSLTINLSPGLYDIVVYAYSTVANTFNNAKVFRVNITAPPTIPRMAVDLPAVNQIVSQNFTVAGWALDLGAGSGTGVDAIHVWAFPLSGAAPIFAGSATVGFLRPDVAAAFGAARWGNSGYALSVSGALPPGEYILVVYAHSTISGTFNNWTLVRIRVV